MDATSYRLLTRIAANLNLAVPAATEPFGSPAWVQFLSRVANATG